jgi:hypothetical protein
MARLPDPAGAEWSTGITQVVVDDERVMTMIEFKARRKGRDLHNFAALNAEQRSAAHGAFLDVVGDSVVWLGRSRRNEVGQ